ncbi:unnamed protein product [Blepharisma stoltei]|uniref:TmcB/TmcC TPR repeats domain-containing protein n=1 Tax=Blepharisma stoltei TaxID=1481888 RepID=A0AAU9JZA5_9CILI|nr:unnamed protein product [Blepharisma stoltei]
MIEMLSQYSNNTIFIKDGLFIIWVTYFYIDVIKDRRLGMVKLAQIKNFRPNFEACIQKLRISKEFHERGFEVLKDIEYLQYLERLSKVKKKDKQLCNSLLDLYIEINKKNTHIYKLRNSVQEIYSLIRETKRLYGLLTVNNNKHPEPFDLYGNLLINILKESSEGNALLKKKHSIKEDLSDDQEHLEECRENVGVIFLSTENGAFGKIDFINTKASNILKLPVLEAIGKNFSDFIPFPYSLNHNEKMKDFLMLGDRTTIEKPHSLILQDSLGYIFECNILVKLTAFKDKAYFLVSFSPISSIRQAILLSEEGEIYSHSSELSSLLGLPQQNMANMYLHNIIDGFELSNMELYNPVAIQHNYLDLKFVHIIKRIKFTEIHLILVISDANEQEMWKNKKSDEQLNLNKNNLANCSINLRNSFECKEQDLFSKNSYKSAEEKIQLSISASQISKSGSSEQIAYQKNKNTLLAIQKFQWIFLLTVLALIATNIGILVYIVENVNDIDLSAVFSNLGNIEYAMISSSNLAYLINYDISEEKAAYLSRDLRFLYWTNEQIILARSELIETLPKWTNCDCSNIATENIVPIWEPNSEAKIRKFNLYDVLSMFIDYGQKLIDDAKREEPHENDANWLIINGASFAINYVHKASIDLLKCEKNSKSVENSVINGLFTIGILVCGICLLILIIFVHFLRLAYEEFWLNLKKAVSTNFEYLEKRITERLLTVHGKEPALYASSNHKTAKLSNYYIKTTLAKRIVFRLSLIIIISLSFYMAMIFALYKDCQESMLDRSRLLQNFKFRSISISRLTRFIKEINDNMLIEYFPETYDFKNTYAEFYKIIDNYNSQYLDLLSDKWGYLLSKEIKSNLFESTNSTSNIMKYGIISASWSIVHDAMLLTEDYSELEYSKYFMNALTLASSLISNFNSADKISKAYIDDQLSLMSNLTFIFSVVLAVLSLFYYLPYLKEEKTFVEKTCLLLEIIINSKEIIN